MLDKDASGKDTYLQYSKPVLSYKLKKSDCSYKTVLYRIKQWKKSRDTRILDCTDFRTVSKSEIF